MFLNQSLVNEPMESVVPLGKASIQKGSSLGQRNGNKKFTGPERPPMQKTFVIPFGGLGC